MCVTSLLSQNCDLQEGKGRGCRRCSLTIDSGTPIYYGHPMFVSRLYQGVDGYGMAGAWLTEALNTNQ
ncbi:hypothetical protein JTE90_018972 [Oedothorax gibbosus]|uniref:Uncharacterized protein n=1 Tax=Oedothorax gibbosus TaxID=931172 RepID=A0AAV6V178_9ARAC|nr:hypothetical protein JTE90_018972 [Oedothorax gibbosus]